MATNEILRFAETDTGTNLLTQAEYAADSQRPIGNQPGVARSKLVNKALRQSSLIASGVAEFLADNQSNNITDSLTPQNIADYMAAVVRSLGVPTAVAGGTANAITADFTPNIALTNGTTVIVRAGAANTTTTPTFAPDGLTAKTIVKGNNLALAAGDIAGAGHWLEMNFDSVLGKWVLQNPAMGVSVAVTPPQFDNDTSLATTAFVQRALGNMQSVLSTVTNTVLNAGDVGKVIVCSGSMTSLTLPDADAVPIGSFLSIYTNTATLTISTSGGDYIRLNSTNAPTSITIGNGDFIELVAIAGAWIAVSGSARLGFSDAFQRSLAASGYQKLPSGLIIQWGSTSSASVTFPITFPAELLHLDLKINNYNSTTTSSGQYTNVTASSASGFTVTAAASSLPAQLRYIAFGY